MTDDLTPRYTSRRLRMEIDKAREYGRQLEREAYAGVLQTKILEAETMRQASINHAQERNAAERRVTELETTLYAVIAAWDEPYYGDLDTRCDHVSEAIEKARTTFVK